MTACCSRGTIFWLLAALLIAGVSGPSFAQNAGETRPGGSLVEARKEYPTHLTRQESQAEAPAVPPAGVFELVKYPAPAGDLAAYLSPDPKDGKKHRTIVWVVGGFGNDIGDTAWVPAKPSNDQSARAFREAGIIMMYSSFRGGHNNVGNKEGFFGEVDDLLAAVDYLSKQAYVDPARIYLGGHSTGGTMALLAAESSDRFRAVFAFGPVATVATYGRQQLLYDPADKRETMLRSPGYWLGAIKNPTFVMEGTEKPSNIASLNLLVKISKNPQIHFNPVRGASHFSVLAPITKLLAQKILADTGASCSITLSDDELAAAFAAGQK